jgi:hypothetical protein
MKFVKIRYEGASPYQDRTALKNVWEPGDEKLVAEADARKLLGYLEFSRAEDSAQKKAKAQTGQQAADAELEQALQAQALAEAAAAKEQKLTESTLLEIEQMDKDTLEAYARANYAVDLDKRRSLDTLRNQVTALVQGGKA